MKPTAMCNHTHKPNLEFKFCTEKAKNQNSGEGVFQCIPGTSEGQLKSYYA